MPIWLLFKNIISKRVLIYVVADAAAMECDMAVKRLKTKNNVIFLWDNREYDGMRKDDMTMLLECALDFMDLLFLTHQKGRINNTQFISLAHNKMDFIKYNASLVESEDVQMRCNRIIDNYSRFNSF